MRCTVPVPIPSFLAMAFMPMPLVRCVRTLRSMDAATRSLPNFVPWALARASRSAFIERALSY